MENKTPCRNLRNNQWYTVKISDEPFRYQHKAKSTIEKYYPKQEWVRLYTDGSAADAIKNGGGGVFTEWLEGATTSDAFPTGATCSNYKAEAEALIVALNLIKSTPNSKTKKFVLLSDAKSVLQGQRGRVVSASDSGSGGRGFDSQPSHVVIALGKQFTLTFPSPPTCKMGTQLQTMSL